MVDPVTSVGGILKVPPFVWMRLKSALISSVKSMIAGALAAHGGGLKPVYESLGISRKTLYEKMQKYGLDKRRLGGGEAGD